MIFLNESPLKASWYNIKFSLIFGVVLFFTLNESPLNDCNLLFTKTKEKKGYLRKLNLK